MRRRAFPSISLLAVLCASLAGAAEPEKAKHPAIGNPEAIASGQKLFVTGCAGCHGQNGEGGRGPKLRNRAVWHTLDDEGLFTTIKKGVPGADMPASNLPDDQIWQMAAYVRAMNSPAIEQNVPGNLSAGEGIFWGKGGCGNCHAIRGKGGQSAPDLSNVGALRPVEQIREDVASPDADGYENWRKVVAVTKDGKTIEGALRNRSNYSLQIQDGKGAVRLLSMASLKEVTIEKASPMPQDYKSRLSREEMRDLVAFLARQSIRPVEEKK